MTLLIASDIHGSARCCAALLERIAETKPDRVLLLGDLLYHGPRNALPGEYDTKAVAEMLNTLTPAPLCVRGNCDSEVDQMISDFPIREDFSTDWQGRRVFFTHGHKCNPDLPSKDAKSGDIVFYGHFHRAMLKVCDGVAYICVGALGLSPEGVERSYAILDESGVKVKTLEGDKTLIEYKFD